MMTLYFSPMACSLASRIAFYEAGIDADFVHVDIKTGLVVADGRSFADIAPLGKVPVLECREGTLLSENAAVLQYIADLDPDSLLAPRADDPARYQLQRWLSFVGTEMHKGAAYLIYTSNLPDAAGDVARLQAERALPHVASHLLTSGRFLLGNAFSVADAYLLWALMLLRHAQIPIPAPCIDFIGRALDRPAVRKAVGEEQQMLG